MTHYEIRNPRGRPMMAFDDEHRARDFMQREERRVGVKYQLFRVRRVEEALA